MALSRDEVKTLSWELLIGAATIVVATIAMDYYMIKKTGSLAPLDVTQPQLIMNVPYSQFRPNYVQRVSSSLLRRSARGRVFSLVSTLDKPVGANIYLYDSSVTQNINTFLEKVSVQLSPGSVETADSGNYPKLGANVDTVTIDLTAGNTSPSVGEVKIYVTEVL